MKFPVMNFNVVFGTLLVCSFAFFGSVYNISEFVYGSLFTLAGMVIISIIMVLRLRAEKPTEGDSNIENNQ